MLPSGDAEKEENGSDRDADVESEHTVGKWMPPARTLMKM